MGLNRTGMSLIESATLINVAMEQAPHKLGIPSVGTRLAQSRKNRNESTQGSKLSHVAQVVEFASNVNLAGIIMSVAL